MNWALLSLDGLFFSLRWFHIFFGVIWIGVLYYFNFIQGPFFAETDAPTKSNAIQKLVPRALWWFRWGAMGTFLTGLGMLGFMDSQYGHAYWGTGPGVLILIGASFATLMWANVWFVIWPAQKIVIASATAVAAGKPADPTAAARGARGGVASRTNVLFSVPMLFFMAAAKHLSLFTISPDKSLVPLVVVFGVIILGLEANALKGKTGPMTSVKGVVHCAFALAVVMYILSEVLTK
ncbi:MAG: urate hydroxylase PuuD [Deltaproteobacteria bacterium]|nr:urate hydroxylase PuuD [Deltaproteobacteria bacterium]